MLNISITKPTLLLDQKKCKANIRKMADKANAAGATFRPHFKTHQSGVVGRWFREVGVKSITVSSVSMAKYFADHGWDDICIAFPVNLLEIDYINQLAEHVNLTLLVESVESVHELGKSIKHPINVYIKIDVGAQRSGIHVSDAGSVVNLSNCIMEYEKLHLKGLLTHAGQTYMARGKESIKNITYQAFEAMNKLQELLQDDSLLLSWGDTPSCSMLDSLPTFNEWRPGNFVFYDVMQYHIGSCGMHEIAVAMACPVVALHPERNQAVIYGGAIHFSKENIAAENGFRLYGYVVELHDDGWSEPVPGAWLSALSQEHGIITFPPGYLHMIKPGSIIGVLPVHSCLTVSCMKEMHTLSNQIVPCMK